jgi:hypothetical protein
MTRFILVVMSGFRRSEEIDAVLKLVGGHHAVADRYRLALGGIPQHDGGGNLGLEPHAAPLVGLDRVGREVPGGAAIGRDRAHRDMPGRGNALHDRRHYLTSAAALGEKIEKAVAFGEVRHHCVAFRAARVLPLTLAQSRNRALERVIEVWILPDCPLPNVAEQ